MSPMTGRSWHKKRSSGGGRRLTPSTSSIYVLLICLMSLLLIEAEISVDRVTTCVNNIIQQQKKRRAKIDKPLLINFGFSGVEAVNVIGPLAIRQINALVECVQLDAAPSHYRRVMSQQEIDSGELTPTQREEEILFRQTYGGYNVTYLTGFFSTVLPDIEDTLAQILVKALKKADWEDDRKQFGIRSVYHMTGDIEGLEQHLEEVRQIRDTYTPPQDFVVFPRSHFEELERMAQMRRDERQRRLKESLVPRPGTVYTVAILLNDRSESAGGHIAIHARPSLIHADKFAKLTREEVTAIQEATGGNIGGGGITGGVGEEEDAYYDDEEGDEEKEGLLLEKGSNGVIIPGNSDSHHTSSEYHRARMSSIEELQLDKGSAIILNAAYQHGFEQLIAGKKSYLAIEYWHYHSIRDPHILRGTIEEGETLGEIVEKHSSSSKSGRFYKKHRKEL